MGNGYIYRSGRKFQYTWKDPSDDEVNFAAKKMQEEQPRLSFETCLGHARANLDEKARFEAYDKAVKSVTAAIVKAGEAKATVGISQRLGTKVDWKGESGGILVEDNNPSDDPRFMETSTLAGISPGELVKELNKNLLENQNMRASKDKHINLAIPKPESVGSVADGANDAVNSNYHELAIYLSGAGDEGSQYAQEFSRLNRYSKNYIPRGRELTGYTFITRPKCNLSSVNIAPIRAFQPLLYAPDMSIQKAIRLALDTQWDRFSSDNVNCPFHDRNNPFLVMACNALKSITGFPDPNLSIETTEGGFFSEQQSTVIGDDRLSHGYDLQLQFKDMQGGPILALHDYWRAYMGALGDGSMHQYPEEIEQNLMGYTVSIYRFIMDPTNRCITRWAKATGCYPKMSPTGTPFNTNEGEKVVSAASDFTVPYMAHHFGYNDPIILKEFNMLVERYCADIKTCPVISDVLTNNRAGIPYINQNNGFNELTWRFVAPGMDDQVDGHHMVTAGDVQGFKGTESPDIEISLRHPF